MYVFLAVVEKKRFVAPVRLVVTWIFSTSVRACVGSVVLQPEAILFTYIFNLFMLMTYLYIFLMFFT